MLRLLASKALCQASSQMMLSAAATQATSTLKHSTWQFSSEPCNMPLSLASWKALHPTRGFSALPERARELDEAEASTKTFDQGYVAPHKGLKASLQLAPEYSWHPVYDEEYAKSVSPKHIPPAKLYQKVTYNMLQLTRKVFDYATGYDVKNMDEAKWLRRMIFLETVAGVPGMVGGMLRHLRSLRSMRKDQGWIHTLLEEAENERMHLLTFLELRQPGPLFRGMVILAQGIFFNLYFISYLMHPKACHAFIGYLEEEAVKTYTHALKDIDEGKLWKNKPAPAVAIDYWSLPANANMRDLILAVRADEACHSHVNHEFSKISGNDPSPFNNPEAQHQP